MSVAELMIEATLFLAFSPSMAAYFLVGCAPVAGVIFLLSREDFRESGKFTGGESLLLCVGASVAFKVILIGAFWLFTGRNIFMPDISQMNDVMTQLYGEQPELREALRHIAVLLPRLFPSMLVLYVASESFLNYSLCGRITKKISPDTKNYPPQLPAFSMWKFPASLIIVSVAGLAVSWFANFESWPELGFLVMNLQIVVNVLMFIQGLSLTFWIMEGFKLRRGIKAGLCCVCFVPFFWPWMIVMGMCEVAINMRERIKFKE